MQVVFRLNEREVREFMEELPRLYAKADRGQQKPKSKPIRPVVLWILLGLLLGMQLLSTIGRQFLAHVARLGAFVGVLGVLCLLVWWQLRRNEKRAVETALDWLGAEDRTVTLQPEGIATAGQGWPGFTQCNRVCDVAVTPILVLFVMRDGLEAIPVPKRAFPSAPDLDAFVNEARRLRQNEPRSTAITTEPANRRGSSQGIQTGLAESRGPG